VQKLRGQKHLLVGTSLLIVKVKALLLDVFKLIVLCTEHVDIDYDSRISEIIKGVINNGVSGAAGVEDGVISIFDTGTIEVGGGISICMERGPIDGLVFALCPLIDYTIVDQEVVNILGHTWSGICANKNKG